MSDSAQVLAQAVAAGRATSDADMIEAMRGLFGDRYHKRSATGLDFE